jgi:hypothetical protein
MNLIRKKHKEASSIGIIGFQSWEQSEERKKLWKEKLAYCKKNAVPRAEKVSGMELKQYLIDRHGAVEMEFPERLKQMYKANLLSDLHPEIFPETCFPPEKGGKRALLKWAKNHDPQERQTIARNIPDQEYGLQFAYLEIPGQGARIYLELSSARMQFSAINNDAEDLIREIILWIGVTKEDIENETPEFLSYADELYRFK